ncbi:MAG: hypothetical protein ACYCS2_06840 [Acidimicrobiales bacterium]
MTLAVGVSNLVLGAIYTCYGIMTLVDLKRGWRTRGFSHFGAAWVAMAFTCGPHHLEHGLHILSSGTNAGALDFAAVAVGFPAGAIWFLLRVEALAGGAGDRFVRGTPAWVAALPYLSGVYLAALIIETVLLLDNGKSHLSPRMTPNILLLGIYFLIGYYLIRAQLGTRSQAGGWSLSGLTLGIVFPTCGLMHIFFAEYASIGQYGIDGVGLTIDWLAVPASIYFVWVVRALYLGTITDWNESAGRVPSQLAAA